MTTLCTRIMRTGGMHCTVQTIPTQVCSFRAGMLRASFTESLHKVSHFFTSMSLIHNQTAKDQLRTFPVWDIDCGLNKSLLIVIFYEKNSQISAPMYEVVEALQPSRHIQMETGSSLASLDKIAPRAMSAHLKMAKLGNKVAKQIREQSCKLQGVFFNAPHPKISKCQLW